MASPPSGWADTEHAPKNIGIDAKYSWEVLYGEQAGGIPPTVFQKHPKPNALLDNFYEDRRPYSCTPGAGHAKISRMAAKRLAGLMEAGCINASSTADENLFQRLRWHLNPYLVPRMSAESKWVPSGKVRVLLIGCTYSDAYGYESQLQEIQGPRNDLKRLRKALNAYGIRDEDMVILTDFRTEELVRESNFFFIGRSTKEQVIEWLLRLTHNCASGDSLFLYFAGHSSQVLESKWGAGALIPTEEDGKDEFIQLSDYRRDPEWYGGKKFFVDSGSILDDDLNRLVCQRVFQCENVQLIALFDTCHSATALDLPFCYDKTLKLHPGEPGAWVATGLAAFDELLTGKQIPTEKCGKGHIWYFAACKDEDEAKESLKGREYRGMMTEAFIRALGETTSKTTMLDFIIWVQQEMLRLESSIGIGNAPLGPSPIPNMHLGPYPAEVANPPACGNFPLFPLAGPQPGLQFHVSQSPLALGPQSGDMPNHIWPDQVRPPLRPNPSYHPVLTQHPPNKHQTFQVNQELNYPPGHQPTHPHSHQPFPHHEGSYLSNLSGSHTSHHPQPTYPQSGVVYSGNHQNGYSSVQQGMSYTTNQANLQPAQRPPHRYHPVYGDRELPANSSGKEGSQGILDGSTSPLPKDTERVRSGGTAQDALQSDNSLGEEDGESTTRNESASIPVKLSFRSGDDLPKSLPDSLRPDYDYKYSVKSVKAPSSVEDSVNSSEEEAYFHGDIKYRDFFKHQEFQLLSSHDFSLSRSFFRLNC